jgi:ankyrin repeat protein
MWAAAYGHAGTAKLLLARGATAGTRDDRGKSAAEMAEEGGHAETSRLLRAAQPGS